MNDIYKNIEEYKPYKKRIWISDLLTHKKINQIVVDYLLEVEN